MSDIKPGDEVWVKCKVINAERDFDVVWPLLLSTKATDSTVLANYDEVIKPIDLSDWDYKIENGSYADVLRCRAIYNDEIITTHYFNKDDSISRKKADIIAAYFALKWLRENGEDSGKGS